MINRRELLWTISAAAFGLSAGRSASQAPSGNWPATGPSKRLLLFTKSSGYEHSVIHRENGKLGLAEQVITDLGAQHCFDVLATKDGRIFSSSDLPQFDAFYFHTTGDLTTEGTDKNPPMTAEGKQRFLDLIHDGKGFVGTHCAADTFDTSGDRFDPRPQPLDPYLQMLGAEFLAHDAQQEAHLIVTDEMFPGIQPLGAGMDIIEEWYPFRDFQPDLHVLTVLDTRGMEGPHYQRPPYPNSWARMHGEGRVFYTALGHREDVWGAAWFQSFLLGGISWALRNVDASLAPNLASVTPGANRIPAGAFARPGK